MSTYQDVAVKIHQLDARWSEDKKRNYTKHVSREVRHGGLVGGWGEGTEKGQRKRRDSESFLKVGGGEG